MSEQQRRTLSFQNLGKVADDVRALHADGYTAVGNWDLSQVCGHLVEWMRFPMDGFPESRFPMNWLFAIMRITMGRRILRKILAGDSMKSGGPTLPATVPETGGDEAGAVRSLCDTIARLQTHDGPLHPSPVFGDIDLQTLTKLQLIHCAHHLSFLLPKQE